MPERLANSNQIEGTVDNGESDVLGANANGSLAEEAFALLDGFPALIEWGEVPAGASPQPITDHNAAIRFVSRRQRT